MSLFDDDPLDTLEYSDSEEDDEDPEPSPAPASAPAPAPSDGTPLAPAPAEEGVPPSSGGGSMFDEDPLADLGEMDMDDSLGSRMKGLGGSFSAGMRGRSSSDAAQRVRGFSAAASTKAQEKALAAQEKAKAATESFAATGRSL
jgi:hypothetical protein